MGECPKSHWNGIKREVTVGVALDVDIARVALMLSLLPVQSALELGGLSKSICLLQPHALHAGIAGATPSFARK